MHVLQLPDGTNRLMTLKWTNAIQVVAPFSTSITNMPAIENGTIYHPINMFFW